MTPKKKSSSHPQPLQPKKCPKGSPQDTPSYLTIQDQANHLMPIRRPCPHLSLNPLTGNSLY